MNLNWLWRQWNASHRHEVAPFHYQTAAGEETGDALQWTFPQRNLNTEHTLISDQSFTGLWSVTGMENNHRWCCEYLTDINITGLSVISASSVWFVLLSPVFSTCSLCEAESLDLKLRCEIWQNCSFIYNLQVGQMVTEWWWCPSLIVFIFLSSLKLCSLFTRCHGESVLSPTCVSVKLETRS